MSILRTYDRQTAEAVIVQRCSMAAIPAETGSGELAPEATEARSLVSDETSVAPESESSEDSDKESEEDVETVTGAATAAAAAADELSTGKSLRIRRVVVYHWVTGTVCRADLMFV